MRAKAVNMASRTPGSARARSAASSAGTLSGSSAAARAAAQRSSSVPLASASRIAPHRRRAAAAGESPAVAYGRAACAGTRFCKRAAIFVQRAPPSRRRRPRPVRPACPRRRPSLRLPQSSCRRLVQARHRCGAIVAHAGHQHADELLGGTCSMADHEPIGAGMPGVVRFSRRGHRHEPAGPPRDDDIGVAAADVDVAGLQWRGRATSTTLQRADAVEPPGERSREAGRHVLRDDDRPRKGRGQRGQQRFERRRAARRGADQHEAVRPGGARRMSFVPSALARPRRGRCRAGAARAPAAARWL